MSEAVEAGGQQQMMRPGAMRASLVNKALVERGLSAKGSLEVRAARLVAHFEEKVGVGGELSYCEDCGAGSDPGLDGCPFCGAEDEEPARGDAIDAPVEVMGGGNDVEEAKVEVAAMTNGTTQELIKPPMGLAGGMGPKRSEVELDKAVGRIRKLQLDGHATMWSIGKELKHIYDSELWMTRFVKGGDSPAYKSFDQFTKAEFGMTKQHAFNAMNAAEHFSEAEVRQVGIGKLTLVLQAAPKDRERLLDKARGGGGGKGASIREVAAEVRSTKPKPEPGGKKRGRKASMTVMTVGEKFSINLYAQPKGDAKPPRAKKLSQSPWGKHAFDNGVVLWARLRETPTGLQLMVQMRREEDEQAG